MAKFYTRYLIEKKFSTPQKRTLQRILDYSKATAVLSTKIIDKQLIILN